MRRERTAARSSTRGRAGRRAGAEREESRRLEAHPYVAVDVVVFAIADGTLEVLLVRVGEGPHAGRWAFPGGLVGLGESLDQAAMRALTRKTGLKGLYLEQLRTFGDPGRDPRGRVVSTAYFALVSRKDAVRTSRRYAGVGWFPFRSLPELAYDHRAVARCALARLRAKLAYTNIVYGLLPREFTLGELQGIYEIILGRPLDRRNFRKKILGAGLLRPLFKQRHGAHRPAQLYSFVRRRPMQVSVL